MKLKGRVTSLSEKNSGWWDVPLIDRLCVMDKGCVADENIVIISSCAFYEMDKKKNGKYCH